MTAKHCLRISTSELTRPSTNADWMRSRNFAIGRLPHCSRIRASAVARSFAIRTTSVGAESAGVTSISKPVHSLSSARTKPMRKHPSRHKRVIPSNGYIRPSVQRATTGRSFRPRTDRLSPESFVPGLPILAMILTRSRRSSTNTTG